MYRASFVIFYTKRMWYIYIYIYIYIYVYIYNDVVVHLLVIIENEKSKSPISTAVDVLK